MEPLPTRAKTDLAMAGSLMFRLGFLIGVRESVWPAWAQRIDLGVKLVRLDYTITLTAYPADGGDPVTVSNSINAVYIGPIDDLDPLIWVLYTLAKRAILTR
jgi:hypothetical protein